MLTCVAEPLPPDAFRPAFCDRTQKIYLARNLKRELLPNLVRPADSPKITDYIRFTQRPWLNTCFFGFEEPVENMPWYGREVGRVVGNAGLLLCSNFTPQQKEPLLDNLVQVGIDYGGMIRAGHPGCPGLRRPRHRPEVPHRLRRNPPRRRGAGPDQQVISQSRLRRGRADRVRRFLDRGEGRLHRALRHR